MSHDAAFDTVPRRAVLLLVAAAALAIGLGVGTWLAERRHAADRAAWEAFAFEGAR